MDSNATLFNEDYNNIIKDLEISISTKRTSQALLHYQNIFEKNNPHFFQLLLENLERYYPQIYTRWNEWEKQKDEIERYELFSDVVKFLPHYSNPQLTYLYSLLVWFCENADKNYEEIKNNTPANEVVIPASPIHRDHTFKSDFNKKQLRLLCEYLVEKNLITVIDIDDFIIAFSNLNKSRIIRKIKWIHLYSSKGNGNRPLFALIKNLCMDEYIDPYTKGNLIEKINSIFTATNGDFNCSKLRMAANRFERKERTLGKSIKQKMRKTKDDILIQDIIDRITSIRETNT